MARTTKPVIDIDIWHEMALAREAWSHGTIPWSDSFSFSPTVYPVVHHEWGAGFAAYMAITAFGDSGIVAIRYILMLSLAAVTWYISRRDSNNSPLCYILAMAAILLIEAGCVTVRAQMYSYVLTAALIAFLRSPGISGGKGIYLWLPVHVVWLNLHAGFLVGCGFFLLEFCERLFRREPVRHMLAAGLCMVVLIVCNPFGWHYYAYLSNAVTMPRPRINEWAPLWNADIRQVVCFLLVYSAAIAAIIRNRLPHGWAIVLVAGFEAMRHQRLLPFFGISSLMYLPAWFTLTSSGTFISQFLHKYRKVFAIFLLIPGIISCFRWLGSDPFSVVYPHHAGHGLAPFTYPLDAVAFIKDRPNLRDPLRLVVPFEMGGFVSWKLWPQVLVSIDSRYEVAYSPQLLEVHARIYEGHPEWRQQLESLNADAVLVPTDAQLHELLLREPNWPLIHQDSAYAIFDLVPDNR